MKIPDLSRWHRVVCRLPVLLFVFSLAFLSACTGGQEVSPVAPVVPSSTPPALPSPSATKESIPPPAPTSIPQVSPTSSSSGVTPDQIPTPPTPTQFPDSSGYEWRPVVSGLENPIGIANAGDGSGRLFILEQAGRIRIIKDGRLIPEPFLDISHEVGCCGERGLLGLAFHPNYENNGFFYINYTDLNGDTVIARFHVSNDPDVADASTEAKILGISQPYPNHNGGSTAFGPDGYLYLGLGDGGSGGDPHGNGQNPNTLLGKILRLDVDSAVPYAIPPDNPYSQGGGAPEVWALGLRNPWRLSFDRLTGDLFIGDVGQNAWEEIDYLPVGSPGGANFGWNFREGMHPFARNNTAPPAELAMIDPVAEYGRDQGITVIGGYVYRGEHMPEWGGIYLYGDYGSGVIWGLLRDAGGAWQNERLFQTGLTITSFGEGDDGEMYLVDYSGSLYRLERK